MHSESIAAAGDFPSAGDFIIRRALPIDIAALVALCGEHADFERCGYEAAGKAVRLGEGLFSPAPRLYAWVAVADGTAVGYATASPEYSTWSACEYLHMDCLFVRPEGRGASVGAALLDSVVQLARLRGYGEVQWQTPHWNVDASRFYRRHGGVDQPK